MRTFLRLLLRLAYGFRAHNETVLNLRGPVLLLPNHVSWWDWLLIGVCLERDWRFVTSRTFAQKNWILRRIMINRRTFPVDMNSPYAVKHMAEYLQKGGRLVLFPEGQFSRTGSLEKLFDGTGFLIFKTKAKVITAYLRGAAALPFGSNPNRKKWFPRVSVHFSNALSPPAVEGVSTTEARARLTHWVRDQMVRQQFETEMALGAATLPGAILATARSRLSNVILEDITLQPVTYRRLLIGANLLAKEWQRRFGAETQRIGVLLPNVNATPVLLLSLWTANMVPAVLNYTTGPGVMVRCAQLAGLKRIITSRVFLERANLDIEPLRALGIEIIFLEDVRAAISSTAKTLAFIKTTFAPQNAIGNSQSAEDVAVILFTSGSEGDPKAVELTHQNLLANIRQMLAVIDLVDTDRFFNALPLFHAFGLTIGALLPLVRGVFVFIYTSPLHYRIVPSAFYNLDCTIFFGTNTFLAGYARKAHPYDFRAARYVFGGAEKIQETTATVWMQKFGMRILEGYGATECSPCVSVNVPLRAKHGSAGQFLPGIEHKLEAVEGVAEAGRLFVRGPNVMRGYLSGDANARSLPSEGWYDTGDIVRVDSEGFVHILGRLKRFAKVSGEMISLAAVEDALTNAFPQFGLRFAIAVIARPDESKGERLIAVTNEARLKLEEIREAVRARGLSNLAVPRELKALPDLPRLGSGKVNHRELERSL
jgi:acyl-[acyl-carrier-protein]-phospholipid O-acyltransferase/long-chain-fatty-acid--[acyl-carrier-protein] ligase